jgi:hypothetical protein
MNKDKNIKEIHQKYFSVNYRTLVPSTEMLKLLLGTKEIGVMDLEQNFKLYFR